VDNVGQGSHAICLLPYFATDSKKLTVKKGEQVVYTPDQGDGWIYCLNSQGEGGYVPSNILRFS
jgi:hypothetical protein